MYYYEVSVSSPKFHGHHALTYSSESKLKTGQVVVVPMQRQTVPAVIIREVSKPLFQTKAIIRFISSVPLPLQANELALWLKEYYPAPMGQLMSLFIPSSLTKKARKTPNAHNHDSSASQKKLPGLTSEQQEALTIISQAHTKPVLLHGNTGSGKTRLYMELAKQALAKNKSVIILTPEIGLTPQLAQTAEESFPGSTVIIHSELTQATRRELWLQILESDRPLVIVGARSALFSPLHNIGLIVVDEFHETSYKQEQAPHYLTTRVAAKLAALHNAQLILGSATPHLGDYYTFQQKKLPIVRMEQSAIGGPKTETNVVIIDLKNRDDFQKSPWLCNKLVAAIETAIANGEQSLVFLNRRGTARLVLCQACGWEALCPRCDLTLTYHGDTHTMQCHTCGYQQKTPSSCPNCSNNDIIFKSIGTKSLVAELQRLFPNASIQRFDSDTAKVDRLEHQYESIRNGQVDILVGTQTLGKGLDLPKLSVLGVALADTSLSFPDYTAEERTFQLLTQVLGRVNRGHIPGRIFVQTYHPESPLLKAAIEQDYANFFTLQIAERKRYEFPPFRFLLKLTCSRASRSSAEKASLKLIAGLQNLGGRFQIIGPSPCFIEKTQDRYHWQIIIKANQRSELLRIISRLPANWSYDIDPINLL